jgi:hypothetical protein
LGIPQQSLSNNLPRHAGAGGAVPSGLNDAGAEPAVVNRLRDRWVLTQTREALGHQSCDPAGALRLLLRHRVRGPFEDLGQHMSVHLLRLFDPI